MLDQTSITSEIKLSAEKKTFRTIHYLGSKLRILNFIKEIIDELDPQKKGVCDLFSGSGAVSQHLSMERRIVSVDIQQYSYVICSALLNPINDELINKFVKSKILSIKIEENLSLFKDIIDFEEKIISYDNSIDLEKVCNLVENASLYVALENIPELASSQLKKTLNETIRIIKSFKEDSYLIMKYFGGVYFSYRQAAYMDAILDSINESDIKYRHILLAALLSTASDIVNTVGKQFAQPIRPRNKNGKPKHGLVKQLKKDRDLDVLSIYKNWLDKYSQRKVKNLKHEVFKMDFKDSLNVLDDGIGVVYADPPYTRDHYSRFYHGLETLCLSDHPSISRTNIGGTNRFSRGLYRDERHQSDFCIKSKAPQAFEELFSKVSSLNKILLLSYSPYDKAKGAHPRVVELTTLESLAHKYFKKVEIRSPGNFSHSKLNRSDLHLSSGTISEILLVCSN